MYAKENPETTATPYVVPKHIESWKWDVCKNKSFKKEKNPLFSFPL